VSAVQDLSAPSSESQQLQKTGTYDRDSDIKILPKSCFGSGQIRQIRTNTDSKTAFMAEKTALQTNNKGLVQTENPCVGGSG